ncbi:hypothetical protein SGCOL_006204 [Colletotrichum sp. CLE4]
MPSGFPRHNDDMEMAIEDANRARTLVFSAASNAGNLGGIKFPASLYRHNKVLCMFATNAEARSLPHFNPTPLPKSPHNFAILGEGIALKNQSPLSGTSFSTVVGAALAGRIIDFSRHPDTRNRMRGLNHIKKVVGMSSVFQRMAVKDGDYDCICPWRILPDLDHGDLVDRKNRAKVRELLCDSISMALEETYKN